MSTETQNKQNSRPVRIRDEKVERAARVARVAAAKEDRRISIVAMVDEILEEGLSKRERKFNIR